MNKMLAVFVSGMSFAGKHDLHGPPLIEHHRFDAIHIMEDQRSPFIPRKAARESYGQSVGVEQRSHCNDLPRIYTITRPAIASFFTCKRKELSLQQQVDVPNLLIRNVHDAIPE